MCECGARNTQGGACIICGRPLGSFPRAVAAALVSAGALIVVWVGVSLVLRAQAFWFGMLFGGLVSGSIAHWSGGRGWRYQALSSGVTVAGIALANTLLLLLLTGRADEIVAVEQPNLRLVSLAAAQLEHDPLTFGFAVMGLMGGFWLWRQPEESE